MVEQASVAIEFVHDGDMRQPNTDITKSVVAAAYGKGLVLLSCGVNGNVVRMLPPLTISDELIDEGLDILEACIDESRSDG